MLQGEGPHRPRADRRRRRREPTSGATASMADEQLRGAAVAFLPPMPAREAFALARTVVVPSRAESMPYLVLEAAAAGVPLIATDVGGIPEILAGETERLVPPGDAGALAAAMRRALDAPGQHAPRKPCCGASA